MRFERCLSKDSALALAVIAAANRASGGTVEIFETPDFIGKWRLRKLCGNVVEGTPPSFPAECASATICAKSEQQVRAKSSPKGAIGLRSGRVGVQLLPVPTVK